MIAPTKNHVILLYPDGEQLITPKEFSCLKRIMGIEENAEYCKKLEPAWKYLEYSDGAWTFSANTGHKPRLPFTKVLLPCIRKALANGFIPWFEGDSAPLGELELITSQGVILLGSTASNWTASGIGTIVAYKPVVKSALSAPDILLSAGNHMKSRAVEYDKPEGERSIEATVKAFNAITGDGLMNTEERGWLFMGILKMVRSQQGDYKADNYEDGTAYFALQGEAAARERGKA